MTKTYASGETPQIGDIVASKHNTQAQYCVTATGDKLAVELHSFCGDVKTGGTRDLGVRGVNAEVDLFSLVSRADAKPQIDVSTIKPGDFVTVRLEVVRAVDSEGELGCKREFTFRGIEPVGYVPAAAVIGHEPKAPEPLKVGDRVRAKGGTVARVIVAINGEYVWTKRETDGHHLTHLLDNLERVS